MQLKDFHDLHKGKTCLLVGVGPNLKLTPPEWFNYPSFSVNTIFHYKGWKPTYYVGVDARLFRDNRKEILDNFSDIPKFIPRPDQDDFEGPNIYRFYHREGDVIIGGRLPNDRDALTNFGITYYRVMDAVMQIAWHMGFTTMLIIGMQHKTPTPNEPLADVMHFWGPDMIAIQHPLDHWYNGYKTVIRSMGEGVRVLNISEDTYVPEDVIPRGDWKDWKNVN
jgi:hypothetical protein